MRTNRWRQWRIVLAAVVTAFCFGACQEWGQMDPPAGTDIYPKTEKVGEYSFDEAIDPQVMQTFAYANGDTPDLVQDADLGSQVLHFNGGYVRFFNPMLATSAEEAVSMTFWVKQAALDEAEVAAGTAVKDINSALFAFQNENGTESLYMTGNGALVYEGMDGNLSVNTSDEATTGMLDEPGVWHYVALMVHNDGYTVYVDGNKRIDQYISNFDCAKLVQFMANTPYLYMGYGAEENKEWWIDDLTIYRNKISSTQIAVPGTGGGGAGDFGNYITIGAEDCSTAWWTAFSDLVHFKNSVHFGFYNYNNNTNNNWCNWVVVVTNGKNRDEEGYAEYFVLRSDAYGWGDANYDASKITHNFVFDANNTFNLDMNGAYVDLTLTRDGNNINMNTVVTTASGTVYNYSFSYTGELEETIGAFLTCEGSYLQIDVEDTYTEGESFEEGSYLVGAEDCSDGFWVSFSDAYTIEGNTEYPFGFIFTNTNNGAVNNWENWLLVVATAELNGPGYSEYLVLRSDAYGWAGIYEGGTVNSGFNWDTFPADMDGAYVRVFVTRGGTTLNTLAKVRTAAGTTLSDYTFQGDGITTEQIVVFLTEEKACLDIHKVGYFPFADNIEK